MRSLLTVLTAVALLAVGAAPARAETSPTYSLVHPDFLKPGAGQPFLAQAPARPAPAAAKTPFAGAGKNRFKGLDFTFGLGASGGTDDFDLADPLVYVRLHVLYRLMKWFAVGLHWSWNFLEATGAVDAIWSMQLGVEARGFFAWRNLDVWTALMLGYAHGQIDGGFFSGRSEAFGIGVGFGARYFVWKMLAVGLAFWLYTAVIGEVCSGGTCGDPADRTPKGINWTFGFNVTWFLPL